MSPHVTGGQPAQGESRPIPSRAEGEPAAAALEVQALRTYWRDLPQLLQERPGQWVAYHGDRQLGFAGTRYELWQECLKQGLRPDEFLIRIIEPEDPDYMLETPPEMEP
jgi:hypothetical protein